MLKSIVSYNPLGKKLLVLEHALQEDSIAILGLEARQKKGELDVVKNFISRNSTELIGTVKNLQNAKLVITGTNILTKEIQITGTDNEILSEAYPNLNLDDFYYQILKTPAKSFIAVCRKQYVASVIEHYQKEGISITDIALGNIKIAALTSFFSNSELESYSASIKIENEEIASIVSRKNDVNENYQFDDISIPNTHTLPLAMLIDSFSNQAKITGNIEEKNVELKNQYTTSQFFKKTLQYGIGFLLIALLINFFIFNSKYKTWQGLQEELQVYTTQKESIKKQKSIVDKKETIVNSIMTTGFSKSSYYIDQIIQLLPTTIILKSFTYQPVAKTIRADKAITIKKNQIFITGNSSEKESFTAWLNTVEELSFVNNVTIISYGVDKKNTSSFEVTINLTDDTAQ